MVVGGGFRCQCEVEAMAALRLITVHNADCLDQLWGESRGENSAGSKPLPRARSQGPTRQRIASICQGRASACAAGHRRGGSCLGRHSGRRESGAGWPWSRAGLAARGCCRRRRRPGQRAGGLPLPGLAWHPRTRQLHKGWRARADCHSRPGCGCGERLSTPASDYLKPKRQQSFSRSATCREQTLLLPVRPSITAAGLLPAQGGAQHRTSACPWHRPSPRAGRALLSLTTHFPEKKPHRRAVFQGLLERCCWPVLPLEKLSSPEEPP